MAAGVTGRLARLVALLEGRGAGVSRSGIEYQQMRKGSGFSRLLTTSGVVALVTAVVPRFFPNMAEVTAAVWGWVILWGILWCVLVVAGIVWYRWRGLWLLVGLPLVLYWPWVFWLLGRDAQQSGHPFYSLEVAHHPKSIRHSVTRRWLVPSQTP